jgi:general secretion pathway protein M
MNINQSASDAGLALKGFTPQGDQSVRVDLEQQPFAAVMAWFGKLQQSGIHPSNVVISSTSEAGLVNVSVTLEGGK